MENGLCADDFPILLTVRNTKTPVGFSCFFVAMLDDQRINHAFRFHLQKIEPFLVKFPVVDQ
jgi:hypothetical protein